MLQPLRKFACEVRRVLATYPSGLVFSNFASVFRSCLGYECIVGHYGSYSKLAQLFEGIPDTAKVCVVYCVSLYTTMSFTLQIVGEGQARKVHLCHSEATDRSIIGNKMVMLRCTIGLGSCMYYTRTPVITLVLFSLRVTVYCTSHCVLLTELLSYYRAHPSCCSCCSIYAN